MVLHFVVVVDFCVPPAVAKQPPPQKALNTKSAPDPPVALLKPGMIMQSRLVVPFPSASYVQQDLVWKVYFLVVVEPPKLTSAWVAE